MVNSPLVIKGLLKEFFYLLLLPESKGGGKGQLPPYSPGSYGTKGESKGQVLSSCEAIFGRFSPSLVFGVKMWVI